MSVGLRIEVVKRGSYHADPPNRFDYNATQLLALRGASPEVHTNRPYFHNVLNQGNIGSCVAQSVAQGLYASLVRQGHPAKLASRLAIYYLARATHKMQDFDTGSHFRAAFQVINTFGFAPEEMWAYVTSKFAEMPPTKVFSKGFDRSAAKRLTQYWRIYEDGTERMRAVKSAVSSGYPIVFGMSVDEHFVRGDFDVWDGMVGPRIGGHAMCIVGYNATGVEIINSWGTSWNQDGFLRMSWDALMSHPRDLWVVEMAPPPKPKA